MAALLLIDELDPPWAYGSIGITTIPLLDKFKIDDVVGAIPVHLFAGIWGTIAVVFSNSEATFGAQIYGIFVIGAFTVIVSGIVWYVIKMIMGIRVTEEQELEGVDVSEVGMEAYPDFRK